MTRYNAMRYFSTEAEAKAFAQEHNTDEWGSEVNVKTLRVRWYVMYND